MHLPCPPNRYFNPRPCARGDDWDTEGNYFTITFQSTPLREGRLVIFRMVQLLGQFQSTPLREGRRVDAVWKMLPDNISIHAPARGATTTWPLNFGGATFQSTPLREGRLTIATGGPHIEVFQSTPLREGRRRYPRSILQALYFNPRPCARGDHSKSRQCHRVSHFNPRPCARGDVDNFKLEANGDISIHAPARGATNGKNSKK